MTETVVENAKNADAGNPWRWIVGIVLLIVSASGVFGQLQSSLNIIFKVKASPKSRGLWVWLRKRLLSMGMVLAILFVLLVALVLSSVVDHVAPTGAEGWARVGTFIASFLVTTLLFAAIFKVLPDARIAWSQVWLGAVVTAGLFSAGKEVVSIYLEHGHVGEDYGKAAGALIALLVWIYYSSIILFAGAEVTRAISAPAGEEEAPAAGRPPKDQQPASNSTTNASASKKSTNPSPL